MSDASRSRQARRATPARLSRLLLLTVATTILVGATVGGVVYAAHGTVTTVADRTAPAATAVQVARASLAEANHAVVDSFRSGTARLAGPGHRYQDGITRASHSLAQLAEYHAGDVAASQQLQFVNAMLVTYMGMVAQADTAHRLTGATGAGYDLGLVYLWHASKLLFDPGSGILAMIDSLGAPVAEDLADRSAGSWVLRPAAVALLLLVSVPLLGLLIAAQAYLLRRFRRVLNPPLVGATAALVVLSVWAPLTIIDSGRDYRAALAAHQQLTEGWRLQAETATAAAHAGLTELLTEPCAEDQSCQEAVAAALVAAAPADPAADPDPSVLGTPPEPQAQIRYHAAIEAAAVPSGLRLGVPLLALAIGVLAGLGYKPRLDEYRG